MNNVNCSKPGYESITCSKIENIPYILIFETKFNDSSVLITIILWDYLKLLLAKVTPWRHQNTNTGYQV